METALLNRATCELYRTTMRRRDDRAAFEAAVALVRLHHRPRLTDASARRFVAGALTSYDGEPPGQAA